MTFPHPWGCMRLSMGLTRGLGRGTFFLIALAFTLGLLAVHPMLIETSQASIHDVAAREDRVVVWSHPGAAPGDRVAYHYSGLAPHELFSGMEAYVVDRGGHQALLNGTPPETVHLHKEHPNAGSRSSSNGTLGQGEPAKDGGTRSSPDPWLSFTAPGPATDRGSSPVEVVWVLHAKPGEPLFTDERERTLVEGWVGDLAPRTVEGTVTFGRSVQLEPFLVGAEALSALATVAIGAWWIVGLFGRTRGDAPAREMESLVRLAEQGPAYLAALRNALAASLLAVLVAGVFATAWWTQVVGQLFLAPQATRWDDVLLWVLLCAGTLAVGVLTGLIVWVHRELGRWETSRDRGRLEV